MLNDCFMRPSGLYRYPSGPSSSESFEPSDALLLGFFGADAAEENPLPPLFPSISR